MSILPERCPTTKQKGREHEQIQKTIAHDLALRVSHCVGAKISLPGDGGEDKRGGEVGQRVQTVHLLYFVLAATTFCVKLIFIATSNWHSVRRKLSVVNSANVRFDPFYPFMIFIATSNWHSVRQKLSVVNSANVRFDPFYEMKGSDAACKEEF